MKKLHAVSLFLAGLVAGQVLAGQAHMQNALEFLGKAESQLTLATADKGGHRQKALELVKSAQAEVQAGINFDRHH